MEYYFFGLAWNILEP